MEIALLGTFGYRPRALDGARLGARRASDIPGLGSAALRDPTRDPRSAPELDSGPLKHVKMFMKGGVFRQYAGRACILEIERELLFAYLLYQIHVIKPAQGLAY